MKKVFYFALLSLLMACNNYREDVIIEKKIKAEREVVKYDPVIQRYYRDYTPQLYTITTTNDVYSTTFIVTKEEYDKYQVGDKYKYRCNVEYAK